MKTIFFTIFVFLCSSAKSQNLEAAKHMISLERYTTAASQLHELIQREPSNAQAWYWLAYTYAQQNKADKGKDSLQKAPQSIWNDSYYQLANAHLLVASGLVQQAQPLFNTVLINTKERDAGILAAVARAQVDNKNGDIPYAIGLLQKAIKRDKRNAEWDLLLGNAYRKMNDGTSAFQAYQSALQKNKNYAPALYQLGLIFVTQKNSDMYLDYFNKALTADPHFAPAIYQLYYHHFNTDPAKAMQYFKEYTAKADPSPAHQYAYTDLLYLNKDYDAAITQAKQLLNTNEKEPRLYKMLAYSYAAKSDTAIALDYMQQYFGAETDSNLVIKDFETIADLYMSTNGKEDSALVYLEKAVNLEKDATVRYGYFKKMADVASGLKNYPAQANYLKQYYIGNATATNVDLFNWGLAHYRSGNYIAADSVFALYVKGHPDQGFGYIWQARSQSAMDKEMKEGKAIPFYQKLIEVVDENKDDETHKKWLVEAYGYLAAYETNTEKDFAEAVNYFEKLLEVDPGNEDAKKYITMLEKKIEAGGGNK